MSLLDRAAVRETQHGNHATQMCPYGTRDATSQLFSPVSSQRLGHGKPSGGYMTLQCQHTTPQQMWCTVTAICTRLTAETSWQQFFRRLSNCDAPSQLISLVLTTASLPLLGSGIRSRQAISIPKRRMLLVSPLRCDIRDIAISLSSSSQVHNGSLLTLSKLHLLSLKTLCFKRSPWTNTPVQEAKASRQVWSFAFI